jgi:hypothetical protein
MTLRTITISGPNGPYVQGEYVRTESDGRIAVKVEGEEITGHPPHRQRGDEHLIDM